MGLWIKNADGTIERTAGGGADGQPGVDGEDGQPGVDGNMWHVGSGAPDPTLGEPGDYYLDGTDGWVYVKRNDSSWTNLYVNLTGPPGSGGGGDFLPLTGGVVTGDLQVNGQHTGFNGTSDAPTYSFWNDRTLGLRLVAAGVAGLTGDLPVDGQIKGPKGTEGAPTFTSVDDPTSGFYAGNFGGGTSAAISVGGTYRISVVENQTRITNNLKVNGQILAAKGSGTAPGLSFASYKGTGFYPGSDNVATYVNGVWQFVVYDDRVRVIRDLQVGGQIKAQNGTQKAPAYSFANETNTGIWYDSVGVEIVKEGTRVAKLLKTATFLPGVNATVMGSSYKANVMSMWNGQLVLIDGLNRSNIKETEAVSHAATNNVYDLQPVWFRSTSNTDDPEHSYYGLIADDCAAIDPRLATYRADEDGVEVADDVNTDAVVALLVSAVKSQRDTIADLTARIETLEGQTRLIK
jgi:hypothetical protein